MFLRASTKSQEELHESKTSPSDNVDRVVNTKYRDVVWLDKHFIIPFNCCQIVVTIRPYCR